MARRRRKPPRFRSHRGIGHAAAFRAHKAALPRQKAFAAHAMRAIRVRQAKALAVAGAKNVQAHPAVAKAKAFRSALPSAPKAWTAKKRKVARYKAARPKGL